MFAPSLPADENRRLEALHNLALLDTPPEPRFDRITRLACSVAKVPIAFICLVDAQRLWLKSQQGLHTTESARETSFCGHTILQNEPLVVADTLEDARFADNPAVIGSPHARFYAGHPIHAPEGARVGTLCVVDTQPRHLSTQELRALADLADLVDAELAAERFDLATRMVGVGVHERLAGSREMWWSDAMWKIFGQDPRTFRASADNWLALVHPDDQAYVKSNGGAWGNARTSVSLQYRIVRPDGAIRHLQSFASTIDGRNGANGRIAGITLDVTERVFDEQREHEQQQKLRDRSHQAGMSEVASDVLHSVGNVVNSLGIAHATMRRNLKTLRLEQLQQATALLREHRAGLVGFLTEDEHGRHLPEYLPALAVQISTQVQAVQAELDTTDTLLEHLLDVLSAQQLRAQSSIRYEPVDLGELLDVTLSGKSLEKLHIDAVRHYEKLPPVMTDRHKLQLILVNLLDNARDAVLARAMPPMRIVLHLGREGDDAIISVEDSGIGMSPEVLPRLWRFGFTTKPNGQGFDLHHSANAAREIGAAIAAESDGPDKGSRFTVRVPMLTGHDMPGDSQA